LGEIDRETARTRPEETGRITRAHVPREETRVHIDHKPINVGGLMQGVKATKELTI